MEPPRLDGRLHCACALLAWASLCLGLSVRAADRMLLSDFRTPYRADTLDRVTAGVPREIELVLAPGAGDWPQRAREALAERIRNEWAPVATKQYGTLHAGLGVWLDYPLLTARVGRRVLVPVVGSSKLPIQGALSLPGARGPRRVVLLIDASSSANARTFFRRADGETETVSVLEAERRALDHLVELLGDDWLEFGLIAFGEQTWPIVEPGASLASVREALARFRQERPRGEGRTDLVCALSLAREWLNDTPKGVGREVYLLTDGDLPHSGRFIDCSFARKRGGRDAEARCLARRNQTQCPAKRHAWSAGAHSDLIQLSAFARRSRKNLSIYPLVFEPDRAARAYRDLAQQSGGELVRVSSPQAIGAVLPALIAGRLQGVFARNEATGQQTDDLLEHESLRFDGQLPLVPGANDIELRVESDRGTAALFRFRVYAAPGYLERYLAELRERNLELELEVADLTRQNRDQMGAPAQRRLELTPESAD